MPKTFAPVLIILLAFFSLSAQQKTGDKANSAKTPQAQAKQGPDVDEYAIYLKLLGRWSTNNDIERIVVDEFTAGNVINGGRLSKDSFPDMDNPAPIEQSGMDDFNGKNFDQKWQLSIKLLNGNSKVQILSELDKNQLLATENFWKAFQEKYDRSQGISTFSRAGFNLERTRGIVYFGTWTNGRAGKGYLVTLEKRSGKWEIFDEQMIIQS